MPRRTPSTCCPGAARADARTAGGSGASRSTRPSPRLPSAHTRLPPGRRLLPRCRSTTRASRATTNTAPAASTQCGLNMRQPSARPATSRWPRQNATAATANAEHRNTGNLAVQDGAVQGRKCRAAHGRLGRVTAQCGTRSPGEPAGPTVEEKSDGEPDRQRRGVRQPGHRGERERRLWALNRQEQRLV